MKKPKSMEKLLEIISLWLGVSFVFFGVLGFIGILNPSEGSYIQDPTLLGNFFLVIGVAFAALSLIFRLTDAKKNKLHSELLANGIRVKGIVDKIYLQSYTRYGTQSPYRVQYSYAYQDKTYRRKSSLVWEKPDLKNGDTVTVYINDRGKSTILL